MVLGGLWIACCVGGCVLSKVSLDGKACPCGSGYACDSATQICIRNGSTDGGLDARAVDGAPDAPFRDAEPADGAPLDGPIDASLPDAGPTDAGPLDAGLLDAGPVRPVDAGLDKSACDSTLTGALFCDGFEDGAGFVAWSGSETTAGSVSWATAPDPVYRGVGAEKSVTTSDGGLACVVTDSLPDLASGSLYVRAYVYLPSGPVFTGFDVLSLVEGSAPVDGFALLVGTGGHPGVYFDEHAFSQLAPVATFPQDRWACVQVHLALSDTTGSVDVHIDGTAVLSVSGIDTLPASGYHRLSAGIPFSDPGQAPLVVYTDEVAAGTSPLPCDP